MWCTVVYHEKRGVPVLQSFQVHLAAGFQNNAINIQKLTFPRITFTRTNPNELEKV